MSFKKLDELHNSDFSDVLNRLLLSYEAYFDITKPYAIADMEIPAFAEFHTRGEKYVLIKKAKLWAAESNEYLFFLLAPKFEACDIDVINHLFTTAERQFVKPHSEHMYTYISAIILTEEIAGDAERLIQRYKFRKSYKLSVHGWSSGRLALWNLADKTLVTNTDGKGLKKMLERIKKKIETTPVVCDVIQNLEEE